MTRSATWYLRRLRHMGVREVAWRTLDQVRQRRWSERQVLATRADRPVPGLLADRKFLGTIPPQTRDRIPSTAGGETVRAADGILAGQWDVLGTARPDVADPDWFLDPVTGRRAPDRELCFRIDHRDEGLTGNVKSVWELSRHHHLTVVAAAWWLTEEPRYAEFVAAQLTSWWRQNPFLSGIHWTSGIELGIRLISWSWIRRLLDTWPQCASLFEDNQLALGQIRWHQEYLAAFRSRGSSGNNHAVAETSGQLVAACAFPWYEESVRWREQAALGLELALRENTFPSGINRELATDYQRFVTELGLVALLEADRAGHPLTEGTRDLLAASLNAAAALMDVTGRPPRQGDGDDGRALVLDGPSADPWSSMLAAGSVLVKAPTWWPSCQPDVTSTLIRALSQPKKKIDVHAEARPTAFTDAGVYLLRTPPGHRPEIWCRCDGGPHGFGTMAAHGHADALSIEVRCDGVDILADPGTYCYHGEPAWRSYFRSTLGHNTVEVDGVSQSVDGGPFLWRTGTDAVVDAVADRGCVQTWSAHHLGYRRLDRSLRHERAVSLDARNGELIVTDVLHGESEHSVRLPWHLGPDVDVEFCDTVARLTWLGVDGRQSGELELSSKLEWSCHWGEIEPILGWYSPQFGTKVPTTTLIGVGRWRGTLVLRSLFRVMTLSDVVGVHERRPSDVVSPAETCVAERRGSGNTGDPMNRPK